MVHSSLPTPSHLYVRYFYKGDIFSARVAGKYTVSFRRATFLVRVRSLTHSMHSALLARTASRVATASSSSHISRSFSAKSGPRRPESAAQGTKATTPGSSQPDKTPAHASPPPSSPTGDQLNVPKLNASETPLPTPPTTLSLDFAPPEPSAERERTGAKSSKDSLSSIERRRRQLGRVSFGLFAIGLLGGCVYLGREWSEDELVERKSVRTDTRHSCVPQSSPIFREEKRSQIRGGAVHQVASRQCSTYASCPRDDESPVSDRAFSVLLKTDLAGTPPAHASGPSPKTLYFVTIYRRFIGNEYLGRE